MSLLLAPEALLPSELWGEIFLFSIPWYMDTRQGLYVYRKAVILPGTICRKWREVALGTPRMWASITLDIVEGYEEMEYSLAMAWLQRSANRPLQVWVNRQSLTPVSSIVDAIVAHCHRWESIFLEMPSSMIYSLASAKHHLPRLRYLFLACPRFCNDPPWTMPLEAFEVAPQLRQLTVGHHVSLSLLRIPWDQLLSISDCCSKATSEELLGILMQASNIKDIQMRIEDSAFPPLRPTQAVQCQLQRLELMVIASDPAWIFDHVTLPSLHEFEYYEEYNCWAQPQFLSFLSRSSCHLRSLTLIFLGADMSEDELVAILQLTHALEVLRTSVSRWRSYLFSSQAAPYRDSAMPRFG